MAGKVTAAKYKEIKAWMKANCSAPADDKKAMEKFDFGQSVIRAIRRSRSFSDYKNKTAKKEQKQPATDSTDYLVVGVSLLPMIFEIGVMLLCAIVAIGLMVLTISGVLNG